MAIRNERLDADVDESFLIAAAQTVHSSNNACDERGSHPAGAGGRCVGAVARVAWRRGLGDASRQPCRCHPTSQRSSHLPCTTTPSQYCRHQVIKSQVTQLSQPAALCRLHVERSRGTAAYCMLLVFATGYVMTLPHILDIASLLSTTANRSYSIRHRT